MAYKVYSEVLNRLFNTVEELEAAEQAHAEAERKALEAKKAAEAKKAQLKATREARAKEVEAAFQEANKAQKKANELLNAFVKDYGSFHTTLKDSPVSIWDAFFNLF